MMYIIPQLLGAGVIQGQNRPTGGLKSNNWASQLQSAANKPQAGSVRPDPAMLGKMAGGALGGDYYDWAQGDRAASAEIDFDPTSYLGDSVNPAYGMSQAMEPQGIDWMGYEGTPIGQLYGMEFEQSPGYQYQMGEAEKNIKQQMAARGLSGSGAEALELLRHAQGGAAQGYGRWQDKTAAGFSDYLSGLKGMSAAGQSAAAGQAGAAGAYGQNMANIAAQRGAASAAQQANKYNIMGDALSGLTTAGGMIAAGLMNPQPNLGGGYVQSIPEVGSLPNTIAPMNAPVNIMGSTPSMGGAV